MAFGWAHIRTVSHATINVNPFSNLFCCQHRWKSIRKANPKPKQENEETRFNHFHETILGYKKSDQIDFCHDSMRPLNWAFRKCNHVRNLCSAIIQFIRDDWVRQSMCWLCLDVGVLWNIYSFNTKVKKKNRIFAANCSNSRFETDSHIYNKWIVFHIIWINSYATLKWSAQQQQNTWRRNKKKKWRKTLANTRIQNDSGERKKC